MDKRLLDMHARAVAIRDELDAIYAQPMTTETRQREAALAREAVELRWAMGDLFYSMHDEGF